MKNKMVKEKKGKTLAQIKAKVAEADIDKEDVIETAQEMDTIQKTGISIGVWLSLFIGIIVLGLGALEKIALIMVVGGVILSISVSKLIMGGK